MVSSINFFFFFKYKYSIFNIDIGAILNISEYTPICGRVSWTDKPINYYFHKIDRTLLEKYFERLKNPKIKVFIFLFEALF